MKLIELVHLVVVGADGYLRHGKSGFYSLPACFSRSFTCSQSEKVSSSAHLRTTERIAQSSTSGQQALADREALALGSTAYNRSLVT